MRINIKVTKQPIVFSYPTPAGTWLFWLCSILTWEFNVSALSKTLLHMLQRYSLAERLRFEAAAIIIILYV
jgi:hypothetical protein